MEERSCLYSPALRPHLNDGRVVDVAPTDVRVGGIGPRDNGVFRKLGHCTVHLTFSLLRLLSIVLIVEFILRNKTIQLLKRKALGFQRGRIGNTRNEAVNKFERLLARLNV